MDQNENNVAAQSAVETETTPTSSPQVEAQPTVAQTADSSNEIEADLTPEQSKVYSSMSEEQRKAFQDMRLENKRLKEETTERLSNESAFAPFKYQAPAIESNGYMDDASRIRAEAAQAAREEIDEVLARQKYPHLFKDAKLEKQMAATWLYEKLNGKNVTIQDVASQFDREYRTSLERAEKVGAQKALEQVTPKEQAALSASSQSSSAANAITAGEELNQLRSATRFGNEDAIVARLKNIPWANK